MLYSNREDTIRCIVAGLTDEEAGGELFQELRRLPSESEEEEKRNEKDQWEPQQLHPTIIQAKHGDETGYLICVP